MCKQSSTIKFGFVVADCFTFCWRKRVDVTGRCIIVKAVEGLFNQKTLWKRSSN
jgi:hypothetical protein